MEQITEQKFKVKTINELMGLEPPVFVLPIESGGVDLPIPPAPDLAAAEPLAQPPEPAVKEEPLPPAPTVTIQESGSPMSRFFAKDWIRYPLIFVVALAFFYGILNFHALTLQISGLFQTKIVPQVASAQSIPADYYDWIKKYYVYANDPQVLAPNADPDHDGLTNIEEYYLGTNPLLADTDGDGHSDGQEVLSGYNPLYSGLLTAAQQKIIADHIDKGDVLARLNLENFQRVAGAETSIGDYQFQIDPSRPGNVEIPAIGVNAPIIWTKDFNKMIDDLKYGTAHHPATPYPGERGTVSIHGHSSGNPGDGNFKTVFTKLNFLSPGDQVFVTVYGTRGEVRRYRYVVRNSHIYSLNDPAQFADLGGYFLNLSTSWPVGTAHQRYVVTTELVGF